MIADIPVPEKLKQRLTALSHENFALWTFIAQNDLFDEAEDFIADDTYGKIFSRCLLVQECDYTNRLPWEEDDLPF